MSEQESAEYEAGQVVVIRLAPSRVAELERLAGHLKKRPDELAKEFLEAEIEAQHGLTYGPRLRKHIYR